jgi:hypothetical protein
MSGVRGWGFIWFFFFFFAASATTSKAQRSQIRQCISGDIGV